MSFKYEVQVYGEEGKWYDNSVAFATQEEAERAGLNKFSAWTMCAEYRVVESNDKVNYRIVGNSLEPILDETPNVETETAIVSDS